VTFDSRNHRRALQLQLANGTVNNVPGINTWFLSFELPPPSEKLVNQVEEQTRFRPRKRVAGIEPA
jgi:hypothetical protein